MTWELQKGKIGIARPHRKITRIRATGTFLIWGLNINGRSHSFWRLVRPCKTQKQIFISFPTTKFLTCENIYLKGFVLVSESEACSGELVPRVFLYDHIPAFGSRALFEHCGVRSQMAGGSSNQSIYFLYANFLLGVFLHPGCTLTLECKRLLWGMSLGMIPASRLLWIYARPVLFVLQIARSPQA